MSVELLNGKTVYKGVAAGPIYVMKKVNDMVDCQKIDNPEQEIERVKDLQSQDQLRILFEKAQKKVGEASAAIFEVHQMMLEDDEGFGNLIR